MSKIVVYDFDGTLSYGDSMEELFISKMRGAKAGYKVYYYFLKVLSKLRLSTVKREKERMVKLLFHSDEKAFRDACVEQATDYVFSPIMETLKKDESDGNRVIVLSASSEFFLKKVVDDKVEILGTTFNCEEGKITSINRHPFYHEKVDALVGYGVPIVDEAYFDSKWDDCLKPLCRVWHKVKDGAVVESGTNEL